MKLIRTTHQTTDSENIKIEGFLLLLTVTVFLSFSVSLWRADRFSQKRIDHGTVQETVGERIQALGRFDQDRHARLQQQWNGMVEQFTAFVNGQDGRLQEILGQSIAHTALMIRMEQERLRAAVTAARAEFEQFDQEKAARWQEKLGKAAVTAYRRAPEGGVAFELAFERETNRLRIIEARTARRLESTLKSFKVQEAEFRDSIPLIYQEAIRSAHRSAQLLEASRMAWTGRILDALRTDLAWQRRPEDYVQMVGVTREILRGFRGVGGFVEYGWPALTGLLAAMAWLGLSILRETRADATAVPEEPVLDLGKRKAA